MTMSDVPLRIGIIHEPTEAEPFLVADKPAGLPTAPLHDDDDSALTQAVALFPQIAAVTGKKAVEKGLVHRIDTATRGLVLVAATDAWYGFLIDAQRRGKFQKWYRAAVDAIPDAASRLGGFPAPPVKFAPSAGECITVQSSFRSYGTHRHAVRPVNGQSGRAARKKSGGTIYQTAITVQDEQNVICTITAGYRHQVRCHLAWIGLPVQNDPLYNPSCMDTDGTTEKLAFTAYKIAFPSHNENNMLIYTLEQ